jgi:hypothetical protein
MAKKHATMIATAIALALAIPAGALAQQNGNGPAVVSPLQLPGTASAPQAQVPQPQTDPGVNWKGVGVGAGTVVGNALYIPAKLVYGILGGVAGGAGWALTGGNTEVANTIWRSSLGGDYVLTPNMVAGQDPIHFSGPTTTATQPQTQALPAAPQASAAYNNGPTSMSTVPPAGGAVSTHRIDSGAGPISGSGTSRMSGPLPSTSIE